MTDEVRVRPSKCKAKNGQMSDQVRILKDTHVYEVALGGSVHETGIRWDVHTFPLVGHTQKL